MDKIEKDKIYQGDALEVLKTFPDESIDCCVTSPAYWNLRDYQIDGQIGMEKTFNKYIDKLISIFKEIRRVMKSSATCFVNLGDTYMNNSSVSAEGRQGFGKDKIGMNNKKDDIVKQKSLCQIPSRFAIAMTDRLGFILRNEIIWKKRNCLPSSTTDRFTVDFEKVFFFVKEKKYYFDYKAVEEDATTTDDIVRDRDTTKLNNTPGRSKMAGLKTNLYTKRRKRCVWDIPTKPLKENHYAAFSDTLIIPMILSGCPKGGIVLDPFLGSGTSAFVAKQLNRHYVGIELNPEYIKIAEKRIANELGMFDNI